MTMGARAIGEFCWINMLTPQPAEARAFFGALLGWTFVEMPGAIGHTIVVGDRDVGGLFDRDSPQTPKGARAHIGVMVKVQSADAAAEKVKALGGQARAPFDVMQAGRMAVCFDPNGAAFDVWEPKRLRGTEVDSAVHGAPGWFETLTTDVERATRFYAALFGWKPELTDAPGLRYTSFKQGESDVAGLMQLRAEMGASAPHWGTYFTVKDVDETARTAVALGATQCVAAQDIPGVGRFCGLTSPQGVAFYAITWAR